MQRSNCPFVSKCIYRFAILCQQPVLVLSLYQVTKIQFLLHAYLQYMYVFFSFFFVDSKTLIPITFKFPVPKLSQLSVSNSNTSLQDKTLGSTSQESGDLLEFLPAYSGKSWLKQQKFSFNDSGSDDGFELQSLFGRQQFNDVTGQCVPSEKGKLPQEEEEVPNPLTESVSGTINTEQ